jgi:hypothetical protein
MSIHIEFQPQSPLSHTPTLCSCPLLFHAQAVFTPILLRRIILVFGNLLQYLDILSTSLPPNPLLHTNAFQLFAPLSLSLSLSLSLFLYLLHCVYSTVVRSHC